MHCFVNSNFREYTLMKLLCQFSNGDNEWPLYQQKELNFKLNEFL